MRNIIFAIALLFFGCSNHNNKQKNEKQPQSEKKIKNIEKKEKNFTIILKDVNLTFKNDKLIYPQKKVILLFKDNSKYSKYQEKILKKLKIKYISTNNEILKKEFNISVLPTIIVLDKNKTIKFENFTPYEFLKEEF